MFMSFNQGHPLLTLSPTVPNNFGEPRSSSPSRRSRPLVDRTDGDDERGVPRLFELEQRDRTLPRRLTYVRKNRMNLNSEFHSTQTT